MRPYETMRGFVFVVAQESLQDAQNLIRNMIKSVSSKKSSGGAKVCSRRVKPIGAAASTIKRSDGSILFFLTGVIVVLLWLVTLSSYVLDRIVLPRFEAYHEGSKRVRPEQCTEDDITSDDIDDILVDPEEDSLHSIRRMVLKHGAVLVPSVLSKETASKLRETIQSSHHTQQDRDDFYVLEQEGRRRRLLNFNEDEVFGRALNEIATHEIMRPLINEIAGPDAALVGLFSITNTPESEAQPWHSDNQFDKSRRQYPDDYHRVYSIVLALQDTTEEMGTTAVCLGTHHCKALSYEAAEYCIDEVEMKTGDSLVFDADIFHRGGAHYDLGGEDRVMLFVVVAASESPEDPRWLPTRYFQLRWDMFGHSIHDFVSPSKWTVWQALGLKRKQNVGYSFISYVLRLVANKMVWRFQFRGKNYAIDWDTVEDFWQQALLISSVVTCVWVTWWGISRFAGTVMAKGLRSNAKKTL